MNIKNVGMGNVVLLAGGDKIYTDIAARFVRSERSLEDIIASEYDANIVKNILTGGHLAATEFDYFIFGVEGYARVTEVQLVRKRLASYLIKSGRPDKGGKRSFDVVLPKSVQNHKVSIRTNPEKISIKLTSSDGIDHFVPLKDYLPSKMEYENDRVFCATFDNPDEHELKPLELYVDMDTNDLLSAIEVWYNTGIDEGLPEEELRYMKPQATEFKAIIGMNAHSLIDWFKIRCCCNAQTEIRHMAIQMLRLCKEAAPDLFINAGANCRSLGYCPENLYQNKACQGMIPTKDWAINVINETFRAQKDIKEGTRVKADATPMWNSAKGDEK